MSAVPADSDLTDSATSHGWLGLRCCCDGTGTSLRKPCVLSFRHLNSAAQVRRNPCSNFEETKLTFKWEIVPIYNSHFRYRHTLWKFTSFDMFAPSRTRATSAAPRSAAGLPSPRSHSRC